MQPSTRPSAGVGTAGVCRNQQPGRHGQALSSAAERQWESFAPHVAVSTLRWRETGIRVFSLSVAKSLNSRHEGDTLCNMTKNTVPPEAVYKQLSLRKQTRKRLPSTQHRSQTALPRKQTGARSRTPSCLCPAPPHRVRESARCGK